MTDPNPDHDSQNMWDDEDEAKTSNLDLIARLRAPCGESLTLLVAEGRPEKFDPLYLEAAAEIERLREAIQWVVRDASYKASEQMGPAMAARWIDRLRSALAGSAVETTPRLEDHENYCNEHGGHLRDSPACYLARERAR